MPRRRSRCRLVGNLSHVLSVDLPHLHKDLCSIDLAALDSDRTAKAAASGASGKTAQDCR